MTRVQPEGPASKILQPGDKIIQVFCCPTNHKNCDKSCVIYCAKMYLAFFFFFFFLLNQLSFLTGKWIQLCEYRSRECSGPPEDISKHCGFDYHKRNASIDSTETDLWRGGTYERRTEKFMWTLIFLYTEETDLLIPVGTIYSRDLHSLD